MAARGTGFPCSNQRDGDSVLIAASTRWVRRKIRNDRKARGERECGFGGPFHLKEIELSSGVNLNAGSGALAVRRYTVSPRMYCGW